MFNTKISFFIICNLCCRSDNKEGLSDEQVENLLLNEDCTDMLQNVLNISK